MVFWVPIIIFVNWKQKTKKATLNGVNQRKKKKKGRKSWEQTNFSDKRQIKKKDNCKAIKKEKKKL